jgi:hypothetical protein
MQLGAMTTLRDFLRIPGCAESIPVYAAQNSRFRNDALATSY